MPKFKNKLGCFILLGSLLGGTIVYHATDKLMHAENLASFALTVIKDDAVTISELPASVKEGSRVDFTLTYDNASYRVDEVLINNESPIVNNGAYSFKMPSQDVSIVIKGVSLIDVSNSITNLDADKGIVLAGLPTKADPGTLLSFKVEFGWNSGYSFDNTVAIYHTDILNENKIEVAYDASSKEYSFTMPDAPIFVDVNEIAKKFTLTRDTDSNANISKVEYSVDGGETYTTSWSTSGLNLTYNALVRVTAKSSDALLPTALKITSLFGDQDIDLDATSLQASFTMPASNSTLFVTGVINYKSVTLEPAEHLAIVLLEKNEDGTYTERSGLDNIIPGTTVYFQVTSTSETYAMSKVTVTKDGSSVSTTTVDGDAGIYSFKMPNSDAVVISATETEIKFANAPFLGTYYGYNLMSTGDDKTCSSSYGLRITNIGEVFKGTNTTPTTTIDTVTPASEGSNDGIIKLANGGEIIYTPNFVLGYYGITKTFANNFGGDYLLATRANDTSLTLSDYRISNLHNKNNFLAVSSYYLDADSNKVYIASLFVDFVNKEYYGDGVSFVLADGVEKFNTKTSTFDVKVNDTVIGTVSNNVYTKAA